MNEPLSSRQLKADSVQSFTKPEGNKAKTNYGSSCR